jgi:hypothetical protein
MARAVEENETAFQYRQRIVIQKILRERRTCIISMHNDKYSTKARIAMRKGEGEIFKKEKKVRSYYNKPAGRPNVQEDPRANVSVGDKLFYNTSGLAEHARRKHQRPSQRKPRASREKDRRDLDFQTKKESYRVGT